MSGPEPPIAPVERSAARVILLDEAGRVLLLRGRDAERPGSSPWWFTPGGGLDDDESADEAARRELFEETGIRVGDLGPVVHERSFELDFQGARYLQHEVFFAARVPNQAPSPGQWTEIEQRTLLGAHWRTLTELLESGEPFYPEELPDLLARLASPDSPI